MRPAFIGAYASKRLPVPAGPIPGSDSYYASVVSLCNFNGTDAATSTTDEKGKTWTFNGNAQLDTAQKKFGTASLLLDGSGDYLSSIDSDDWHFGSGDFTMELFLRPNNVTSLQTIACQFTNAQANLAFRWFLNADATVQFEWGNGSVSQTITSTTTLSLSTWYHLSASRTGNVLAQHIDGVLAGPPIESPNAQLNSTSAFQIGRNGTATQYLDGWIDSFRVTKGVGRYPVSGSPLAGNFSPPSTEFPNF